MAEKPLEEFAEIKALEEVAEGYRRALDAERVRHALTKSQLRSMHKEAEAEKELRDYLFGLTHPEEGVSAPKWAVTLNAKKSDHIPVLVASDFQWGEVIDEGRMGGVNKFNIRIAQERYRRLIERTIDISFNHLPNNTYRGIVYLRLGDMVSGDIHEDLNESNEEHAVGAVRSLVAAELWGIQQLQKHFKKVYVISVPGNHGRTTKRPMSKRGAFDNYDTLSSWWLESMLGQSKDIDFYTPSSGDAFFSLYGRRYLATHGDRIGSRGGQGFIGPAATIMRGMKKTFDICAGMHMAIDKMFIGHFHVAYELDYGWSNGSLPGYSEFARDNRMKPEEPTQWLLFFHKKYGATSRWRIRLSDEPYVPQSEEQEPFKMEE